jgi:hypothetical protein
LAVREGFLSELPFGLVGDSGQGYQIRDGAPAGPERPFQIRNMAPGGLTEREVLAGVASGNPDADEIATVLDAGGELIQLPARGKFLIDPAVVADIVRRREARSARPTRVPATPADRLIGKEQILEALQQPADLWDWIVRASKKLNGPIITRRGGKAVADRGRLLEWWNVLEDRQQESAQRQMDRAAVSEGVYPVGKVDLAPDVDGYVKKQRKPSKV